MAGRHPATGDRRRLLVNTRTRKVIARITVGLYRSPGPSRGERPAQAPPDMVPASPGTAESTA